MNIFRDTTQMEMLLHPTAEQLEGLDQSIKTLTREGRVSRKTPPPPGEEPATIAGCPTQQHPDAAFQLGACLISHDRLDYIDEGLELMETLAFQLWSSTGSTPTSSLRPDQRTLLATHYYYIAIGKVKQKKFDAARNVLGRMRELDPQNHQAQELQAYIEDVEYNSGVKGLLGTASAIGLGAIAVGALLFRKRR